MHRIYFHAHGIVKSLDLAGRCSLVGSETIPASSLPPPSPAALACEKACSMACTDVDPSADRVNKTLFGMSSEDQKLDDSIRVATPEALGKQRRIAAGLLMPVILPVLFNQNALSAVGRTERSKEPQFCYMSRIFSCCEFIAAQCH